MRNLIERLLNLLETLIRMGHRILYIPKPAPDNPCLVSLPNGLIGYYKLNDNTNTLVDEIAANNLTNNGANLQQTGLLNKCIGFDTLSSDYVTGTAAYDGLSYDVTISFWFKVNAINTTYAILNSGNATAANKIKPHVYLGSNNILQLGVRGSSSPVIFQFSNMQADTWYNVTISIDITNQEFYVSLDGTPFDDRKGSFNAVATSYDGIIYLGKYTILDIFRMNGYVDDIKIWNRLISDCENLANYNSGIGVELDV